FSLMSLGVGRTDEALTFCERALEIRRAMADGSESPASQRDLALVYSNLGSLKAQTGKLKNALDSFESERIIRQRMAETDPKEFRHRAELANSLTSIGRVQAMLGNTVAARSAHHEALAILRPLVEAYPGIGSIRSILAVNEK